MPVRKSAKETQYKDSTNTQKQNAKQTKQKQADDDDDNILLSPLWSSGQSFWLQIQRSRVRFPALPDFLSSSGSGTGSTQPREVN